MKIYPFLSYSLALLLWQISLPSSAVEINQLQQQVSNAHQSSVNTQISIDQLHSQLNAKTKQYQNLERQLQRINNANKKLEARLAKRSKERGLLEEQRVSISDTDREIQPLMREMQRTLVALIQSDVPFMREERLANAARIAKDFDRTEIDLAQKYSGIVEGFLTELAYGRELQSYQGELEVAGELREVNFLRLGRIALYYQSLDKKYAGLYSTQSQQWLTLSAQASRKLALAISVANGKMNAELLSLPLPPIEDEQ